MFYRNDIYGITLIITEYYIGTFRNDILHKQNTSTIINTFCILIPCPKGTTVNPILSKYRFL